VSPRPQIDHVRRPQLLEAAAGAEGEAAASLVAGLGEAAGAGRLDVATGACCEPPTTAYEIATTSTTTASTMATTRRAAPVRRGRWGSGAPGGCHGPLGDIPE